MGDTAGNGGGADGVECGPDYCGTAGGGAEAAGGAEPGVG